ncbi:Elicitor-responsive protein 3 [Hibiscus syriacus]|uniref:Elicitor-responsive protein 3 n=1 Tax=Hibiscus syriacus TaxID=106335 RepID=A0A6A2ZTS7_HIBSY|nr:elicitor-responsive protein 3-like [Hibiscus syriacus]KAE8694602.1 Elicitor-responsive protein 3 [Hibiscus syriacus]
MPQGSLEVSLVSAKGLEDMDTFGKMDPFVIMTLKTQEQKSSVATGHGSEPVWNENFVFNVSKGAEELKLKIMDSDIASDDFVGEAEIPLRAVFREGNIPPTAYNVVRDKVFKGEIKVGLTFTPEGGSSPVFGRDESYGGWKQSSPGRHSSEDERDNGRRKGKSHGRRRHSSDED